MANDKRTTQRKAGQPYFFSAELASKLVQELSELQAPYTRDDFITDLKPAVDVLLKKGFSRTHILRLFAERGIRIRKEEFIRMTAEQKVSTDESPIEHTHEPKGSEPVTQEVREDNHPSLHHQDDGASETDDENSLHAPSDENDDSFLHEEEPY